MQGAHFWTNTLMGQSLQNMQRAHDSQGAQLFLIREYYGERNEAISLFLGDL